MINEVKQAIQSYYPKDYLFLEFLRSGGWQEQVIQLQQHTTQERTRWLLDLDGLRFEMLHTTGEANSEYEDPENVFVRVNRVTERLRSAGSMTRIYSVEQIPYKIDDLMRGVYHSHAMRGRSYHCLL